MKVPPIIPEIEQWPIAKFYRNRSSVVDKLTDQAYQSLVDRSDLETLLTQTIYAEKLRVKRDPLKVDPPNEYPYWKKVESDLAKAIRNDEDALPIQQEALKKIIARYAEEIVGDFQPKTFRFARKMLTFLFKMIFHHFWPKGEGPFWGKTDAMLSRFKVTGPIEHIQKLFDKGTVMVLPTHSSNLDSILMGYGIETRTGMPAFSYGAGLNLYDYELAAYYMSRLGAYKIDRRKRNPIYRATLDMFATVGIQEGLNSIFYPGGTRSRSGQIESKLKLGLMNTIIDSQNQFYLNQQDKKIIIVPLITSYHFVFEARSLIDQYLRKTGKENYVDRSKKKNPRFRTLKFIKRLFKRGTEVTMSFGHPIDIFGNKIDIHGHSTKDGRKIDIKRYFVQDGQLSHDAQRNRVYSRHLADALVKSYKEENVVLTSQVLAFTAWVIFEKQHPNLDIYALVSLPEDYLQIDQEFLYQELAKVLQRLKDLDAQDKIKLSPEVEEMSPEQLVQDGLYHLNSYHFYLPLKRKENCIVCEDLKLLYYYHNRLYGYKLDRVIAADQVENVVLAKTLY